MKLLTNLLFYLLALILFLFFAMAIITTPIEAHAHLSNDLEHRLAQYRQMYFELEFTADIEELEYLQRKIRRLESEIEHFGNCSLTMNLAEVN